MILFCKDLMGKVVDRSKLFGQSLPNNRRRVSSASSKQWLGLGQLALVTQQIL
jgi:hypothetical protein